MFLPRGCFSGAGTDGAIPFNATLQLRMGYEPLENETSLSIVDAVRARGCIWMRLTRRVLFELDSALTQPLENETSPSIIDGESLKSFLFTFPCFLDAQGCI